MNLRLVSGGLKVIVSFYQSSSIKKINFTWEEGLIYNNNNKN